LAAKDTRTKGSRSESAGGRSTARMRTFPPVGRPAAHVSARRRPATRPRRAGRRRPVWPCRTRRGPSSADQSERDLAECPGRHRRRGAHRRPRRSVPVDPAGRHADCRGAGQVPRMHPEHRGPLQRHAAGVGGVTVGVRVRPAPAGVADRQPALDESVQAGARVDCGGVAGRAGPSTMALRILGMPESLMPMPSDAKARPWGFGWSQPIRRGTPRSGYHRSPE